VLFAIKDFMTFFSVVNYLVDMVWSLPILLLIFGIAVYMTLQLKFVQFRYLPESIRNVFSAGEDSDQVAKSGNLSPFQAFINTLGANIGNGSLAGIAVAISSGGPGAIVWLLILATFSVVLRFAEVFLGTYVIGKYTCGNARGGPMVYMSLLPGGAFWSYLFTIFALGFMLVGGNLAQCNAVGLAVSRSLGVSEFITAFFVLIFILYILLGGSERIVYFLDKLVPFKVFAFLITAVTVLVYHYQAIPHALYLMMHFALTPEALLGGSFGFALQQAMSSGFQQSVFASEAGLGTAAIAFSTTKGKGPVKNGILAMLGVFINIHVICFLVALCIIASGVWDNGETSTALLVSAYETVFGRSGGWIISILAINFAVSVLVAAAYNGKKCWEFLLAGKYQWMFPIMYAACAFCGTWMQVELVWNINNIVNALLLLINLMGLLWFTKVIKKELEAYSKSHG